MTNTWYLTLFFAAALVFSGLLGLLLRRSLIKLFIAIEVVAKGISLLLLGTGFAKDNILVAQTLVVTFIVVEVSLVATALALIINIARQAKSLDIRQLSRLKG